MVRGLLTRAARTWLIGASALAALLALAPAADAANRRVAISNYQWSLPDAEIDLGEHVTWYWTGPDTIHSVTGTSTNAQGLDSDPGVNLPNHPVGDSFHLSFDAPGAYEFACKLHPGVRGSVRVSATPGDPTAEPDPVPANKVDQTSPRLRDIVLSRRTLHRAGARLRFALDERGKVAADFFRIDRRGRREYAGYQQWRDRFIGFNDVAFAGPGKHFKARPGRYLAKLTAGDALDNVSPARKVHFEIRRRR